MFERHVRVACDDAGVACTFPSGARQAIAWDEVRCVAIETNDSGPCGADVWWRLEGSDAHVAWPQGATGDREMLEELPRRFPGFSHEAVIAAMGCADNARFVCWERQATP